MDDPPPYAPSPPTWNEPDRIAAHRELSPAERLRLTLEVSRAVLRFAPVHDPRES